ncbi:MAG: hypothetical protein ACXADH_00380 [Candidatus Kariarchaeaceae archaeon]|jgi:hypothetical protein
MSTQETLTNYDYVATLLNGGDINDLSMFNPVFAEKARDPLFREILESCIPNPVRVFQIGATESLKSAFRIGSGWSELFWGHYVKSYGGSVTVVDINMDHIAHSSFLANHLKYPVEYLFGDGGEVIKEGYDIYYLDGADISQVPDAHIQTLNQFKAIEHTASIVLVDDAPTKAEELIKYLDEKGIDYERYEFGNGMLKIDLREQNAKSA